MLICTAHTNRVQLGKHRRAANRISWSNHCELQFDDNSRPVAKTPKLDFSQRGSAHSSDQISKWQYGISERCACVWTTTLYIYQCKLMKSGKLSALAGWLAGWLAEWVSNNVGWLMAMGRSGRTPINTHGVQERASLSIISTASERASERRQPRSNGERWWALIMTPALRYWERERGGQKRATCPDVQPCNNNDKSNIIIVQERVHEKDRRSVLWRLRLDLLSLTFSSTSFELCREKYDIRSLSEKCT